jgi:4-hydroxy-tetrahydrodipicolinate synthase
MARFGRIATAMVTPFDASGALDLGAAVQLAQWLVEQGNEGLIIAGTTGESPTLTQDEQIDLIASVAAAVEVPVVAGTGSNDTAAATSTTQRATDAGADGILLVAPYYNRPPQAGLRSHFQTIAAATPLPVMLYDVPARTGAKIATSTVLELAEGVENVVALKDAAGDVAETARLIAAAPEGFEVYSGDDALTLPLLAVGAVGTVGVATHWTAPEHQEMFAALDRGDLAAAAEVNRVMLDSFAYESLPDAPNPIPAKTLMRVLGHPVGPCRPPLDSEPADLADKARSVLGNLGRMNG